MLITKFQTGRQNDYIISLKHIGPTVQEGALSIPIHFHSKRHFQLLFVYLFASCQSGFFFVFFFIKSFHINMLCLKTFIWHRIGYWYFTRIHRYALNTIIRSMSII